MKELEKIISEAINTLDEKGKIQELVEKQVEETVKRALSDSLNWQSESYNFLKSKCNDLMFQTLKSHDFEKYFVTAESCINEIMKKSMLQSNLDLFNKLELMAKPVPKETTLSDIFDIYVNFIENNFRPDHDDVDIIEDGQTYANCVMKRTDNEYATEYEFYIADFADNSDDFYYKIRVYGDEEESNIYQIYQDRETLIDFENFQRIDDFSMTLLIYKNNFVKIKLDEEELEETATVDVEY